MLLTDCTVNIYGENKSREEKIQDVFDERIKLNRGEFITSFCIDKQYLDLPYIHVKKTKNEKIDYPLISASSIMHQRKIRMAFSGFANYPFRSFEAENIINDKNLSPEQRADNIIQVLSDIALNNISGSAQYRRFVLKNIILDIISRFGELQFGKI